MSTTLHRISPDRPIAEFTKEEVIKIEVAKVKVAKAEVTKANATAEETEPVISRRLHLASFSVPLAFLVAMAAFAPLSAEVTGQAATYYLGLLGGCVLAVVAALAPLPAFELGGAALLIVVVPWVVAHGPHRAAIITLLLVAAFAVAVVRRWRQSPFRLTPETVVPTALGLQLLLRCDLLLSPLLDLRMLVSLLLLPTLSGLALSLLAQRFAPRSVALAGGVAVLLAPGWNVTVTLALAVLAAAANLADERRHPVWRALAVLVLVAPVFWNPLLGGLFTAAGVALAVRGRARWLPFLLAAAVMFFTESDLSQKQDALRMALLAPGLVGLFLFELVKRGQIAVSALLAMAMAWVGAGPEVMTAGLVLTVLWLPATGATRLQEAWTGLLVVAVAVLSVYPWVREDPLGEALHLFGLELSWASALPFIVGASVVGFGLDSWQCKSGGRRQPIALWIVAVLAVVGIASALPAPSTNPIGYVALRLDKARSTWFRGLPEQRVSRVTIDSHLIQGAELASGTAVAEVRLHDADRRSLASWTLHAGEHTAEWAAARPDIAHRPGFAAPPPWLSEITVDRSLFVQRFRSHFVPAMPVMAGWITLTRSPDLPPDVQVVIHRLELRH